MDEPVTKEGTRRIAKEWVKRYSRERDFEDDSSTEDYDTGSEFSYESSDGKACKSFFLNFIIWVIVYQIIVYYFISSEGDIFCGESVGFWRASFVSSAITDKHKKMPLNKI